MPITPARQVGNLFGGRKARQENELVDFFVAQVQTRRHEVALHGFGQNALAVQALAVVTDFDDDGTRLVICVQRQLPHRRFARQHPVIR